MADRIVFLGEQLINIDYFGRKIWLILTTLRKEENKLQFWSISRMLTTIEINCQYSQNVLSSHLGALQKG